MPEVRLVDLHKEYPGVIAVKNVSITFATASVTCLLGPSGCGKTTMMRIIAGLETPTAAAGGKTVYIGAQNAYPAGYRYPGVGGQCR